MTNNVVDMKKYKNDKLAEQFFAAFSKQLPKEDRPSLEKLKEAK